MAARIAASAGSRHRTPCLSQPSCRRLPRCEEPADEQDERFLLCVGSAVGAAGRLPGPGHLRRARTPPRRARLSAGAPAASAPLAVGNGPPVVLVVDPAWPPYAQPGLSVAPDPPEAGQPAELCAQVANGDAVSHAVALDFGVRPFGVGLPLGSSAARRWTCRP